MNDYSELRADAERRLRGKENWGANPFTVLALLDEVERLRAALETVKRWGDGLKDPEQTYVAEVLLVDALAAVDAALNSSTEVTR